MDPAQPATSYPVDRHSPGKEITTGVTWLRETPSYF